MHSPILCNQFGPKQTYVLSSNTRSTQTAESATNDSFFGHFNQNRNHLENCTLVLLLGPEARAGARP